MSATTNQQTHLTVVSDLSGLSDEDLMLRYRDGDVAAFDLLVRKHRNGLLNFLFRMTRNRDVAEEVQGDVWLKIHRAAARYEPRAKFTTYLYTVAYRQCLTVLESRANKVKSAGVDVETMEQQHGFPGGHEAQPWANPERAVGTDEQLRRLCQEIDDLPEAHRAAFNMYYGEGMSCTDVASVLNLTAKEVKGRLAYARRLLRERVIG